MYLLTTDHNVVLYYTIVSHKFERQNLSYEDCTSNLMSYVLYKLFQIPVDNIIPSIIS